MGLSPFPPLPLAHLARQRRQLLGGEAIHQGNVLEPTAAVFGEKVAQDLAARLGIGLGADEHRAAIRGRDLLLGHRAADQM
jgi:hypothetical protein